MTGSSNESFPTSAPQNSDCKATQTSPRWDYLTDPNEPLAFDVEFQDHKPPGCTKFQPRRGRVAVVNTSGQFIYDIFVRYPYHKDLKVRLPPEELDFTVTWSAIRIENGATPSKEVERNLMKMFNNRLIIGHGIGNDLRAIGKVLEGCAAGFVDTESYYGQVALGTLVARHLTIDFRAHDPIEDAKAAMQLHLLNPYVRTPVAKKPNPVSRGAMARARKTPKANKPSKKIVPPAEKNSNTDKPGSAQPTEFLYKEQDFPPLC